MEVPIGTLTSRLARGRMALQSMLADPPPTQVHGEGWR
jgi:DNA-directed RNA polymerase specialized sigma24 family protein